MKKIGILFTMLALLCFAFAFVSCYGQPGPSRVDDGYRTITFNGNAPDALNVPAVMRFQTGTVVTIPQPRALSRLGWNFVNWNTQAGGGGTNYSTGDTHTLNENLTLYAIWAEAPLPPLPPGTYTAWVFRGNPHADDFAGGHNTLQAALTWLATRTGAYTVRLTDNQTLAGVVLGTYPHNYPNIPAGLNLTLRGDGPQTISLSSAGPMFNIVGASNVAHTPDNNTQLTLGDNITLQGHTANNAAIVQVRHNALFTMQPGSTITGNTVTGTGAGGVAAAVHIFTQGRFNMTGGTITGNSNTNNVGGRSTGGVLFSSTAGNNLAPVNLSGGSITGNTGVAGDMVVMGNALVNVTMSGDFSVGNLWLNNTSATGQLGGFVNITPDWNGTIGTINLRGGAANSAAADSLAATIGWWMQAGNNDVVRGVGGRTFDAAFLTMIGGGNFIGTNGTVNLQNQIQPISQVHRFELHDGNSRVRVVAQ